MDESLAGKMLVAMPGLEDPLFSQSVIVMCEHAPDGAMGLIVNKPKAAVTLGSVLEHLGIAVSADTSPRAVLAGGPVATDRGYVLHSSDYAAPVGGTRRVASGIRLTATRDVLEAMGSPRPPSRFLLTLGCASWGAGQIESELKRNAWLVVDADEAIVFDEAHDAKWTRAIGTLGIDPAQLIGGGKFDGAQPS